MVYKRIGEVLVAGGYLTDEQLKDALAIQKKSGGKKLGDVLGLQPQSLSAREQAVEA